MRERSSTTCKNFQDFQRWQNDIVDNTVRHNSVDNGLYHGVCAMEPPLHPGHEPNDTATSQGKPWIHISRATQAYKWRTTKYTNIVALSNATCSYRTRWKRKERKMVLFPTNSHGAKRGKCQMLPWVRLQRNSHFHPTEPSPLSWSRGLTLPWTKESVKESVAKMSAGALAYSAMTASIVREDFHGAMRLIMMRWGLHVLLNVRVQQAWLRWRVFESEPGFNSEWYINEMHHNMGSWYLHSTEGARASLMHQTSVLVWYKPVTSSYPTSYGNLYLSVKHFGLCGADFGVCIELTEPKGFADRRPGCWRCICAASAVLIYHICQMGMRWLPHGMWIYSTAKLLHGWQN